MSEWKEFKLGSVINTNECSVSQEYPHREILYLDTGSITKGKIDQLQPFSLSDAPSRAKRLVKHSDIVYSTVRPIQRHYGYIENPTENLVVSTGFVVISCLKKILDPKFTYYYLSSDQVVEELDIIAEASTSTYPSLKPSDIEKLTVRAPIQIEEQKAIAAILSSLDDKIELLHRQNKTLESMAETLFRQWFIEEAQEELADTTLDCHSEVMRGLSYKGSGLSDSGLGIPMHNLNSIYEGGGYKEVGIKYYKGEFKERHLVRTGDIIVANTEQGHEFKLIGCPAIVPSFYGEKGLFSQHIYRVILNEKSYLTTEYLYYLLLTPSVREQIISATNGSTVNMLAIDGLQRPKFKLPPKEKVVEFSELVKSWWKKKDVNHLQLRTLEKLRDNLLPKLIRGDVRVKN